MRLGKVYGRLPGRVRRFPVLNDAAQQARRTLAVERLLASGIFDSDWYELQSGRVFASDREAVRDYVVRGRKAGLSPHPLFEPSWYDQERWRTRQADPVLVYLAREADRRKRSPHILFHPRKYAAGKPEADRHPAGPLGHFVQHADAATPLPLGELGKHDAAQVTWGRARPHLEETVRTWRAQEALRTAPRRYAAFDHERERAFRARVAGTSVPEPTDVPLVTVVMPVWNRSTTLRTAVASVQQQTLGSWELLAVDDGSTDDTPAVLEGLAAFEPRLRILREEHQGVSRARNTAIAAARGRYVAFLDSDNAWQPDFLRTTVAAMEAGDLPAAYAALEMHNDGQVAYRGFEGGRDFLLVGNHVDLNVLVVRTDVLRQVGGFSEDLRRTVDYDLVLKLSEVVELTYLPFVGAVYSDDRSDDSRISVREPRSWLSVVLSRHAVAWSAAEKAPRVRGRTSVVVPVREDVRRARRCVMALLDDPDADVEVIVVDCGSSRASSVALAALELVDSRVRVHRVPSNLGFPLAVDIGLARTTGEYAGVCDPSVVVNTGWLEPLVAALCQDGVAAVQPLVLGPDGSVAAAGATFTSPGTLPTSLLAGHPLEDVAKLTGSSPGAPGTGAVDTVEVPALTGRVLLARADALIGVRGLDCLLVEEWHAEDLSLRLRARGHGRAMLVPGSLAWLPDESDGPQPGGERDDEVFSQRWIGRLPDRSAQLWERAGFQVLHHRTVHGSDAADLGVRRVQPVVARRSRRVSQGPAEGLPSLRWSIKVAAPSGPSGMRWGDYHFARSIAEALGRLGQDAVVDFRQARRSSSEHLDDVSLVIRGLDHVVPDELRTSLLWVISHPDLVTAEEARSYDAVFAAGTWWASSRSRAWEVPIEPLLQCTDPSRFHPDVALPVGDPPVLFVGNSRGVYRPVVKHAVEAGVDVRIYGAGWVPFVGQEHVAGISLPNEEVARAYRAAGVVLNDHWHDMRLEQFYSNRIFDVAAVAGRLVSDDIEGLEQMMPGVVRTWREPGELVELLSAPIEEVFGSEAERREVAAMVARDHSFDARARRLLDVAVERL